MKKWHFFSHHFNFYNNDLAHPFAESVVKLVLEMEEKTPTVGDDYLKKTSSICGKEKDKKHFNQLVQTIAEMMVVNQAVRFDWGENKMNKNIQKELYEYNQT